MEQHQPDALQHFDGSEEVGLEDVRVGPVVDQVDLAEVHREGRGDRVLAVGHRLSQMLVVLVEIDEAGPDENVHDIQVVLDVLADVGEVGCYPRARPVGAEGSGVGQSPEDQQVCVSVASERLSVDLKNGNEWCQQRRQQR